MTFKGPENQNQKHKGWITTRHAAKKQKEPKPMAALNVDSPWIPQADVWTGHG